MGPGDNGLAKVRMVVNQTDCMLRRMVLYDKDGKEMAEMRFTNVKVNGPIDPALFKYTPPDGVKINDMTGGVLPAPKEKTPKDDEKRNEE
jgi:outer membrane lipoprotein-sorting protein